MDFLRSRQDPGYFLAQLTQRKDNKYAKTAQAIILGIPMLSAIWADAIAANTEAQPLAVQAYARWTGLFRR